MISFGEGKHECGCGEEPEPVEICFFSGDLAEHERQEDSEAEGDEEIHVTAPDESHHCRSCSGQRCEKKSGFSRLRLPGY